MNKDMLFERQISVVKTGLFVIANAMIVHEALAVSGAVKNLNPLLNIDQKDPARWLINEWNKILATNYRMVFEPAIKLLKLLPSHHLFQSILIELSNTARKAVSNRAVFRHDLAGRLYHVLLLREIAKGLATYYTSIPAATILASLALDYINVDWGDAEKIRELRIVDYACGSGTLLSAVYTEVMDRYVVHAKKKPIVSMLHKVLLENVLYGFDVLEYAVHLTSTSLILRDPTTTVTDTNTYVVPLGVIEGNVYLGSLSMETGKDEVTFPAVRTLTGTITRPVLREGVNESASISIKMRRPDAIIMNPPFARTGNVGKSSLFGHLPRAERKEVLEELKRLGEEIAEDYNLHGRFGRAGLAAFFLMKSYEASREGGVLAFVLPRVFLSGSDWSYVREFLANRGMLRYIIVSDDPKAFWAWSESTDLSEILLIYTKGNRKTNDDGVRVVYVRKRPRSALEAKMYSRLIKAVADDLSTTKLFSPTHVVELENEASKNNVMYVYKVSNNALRRVAKTNLNLAVGFHSSFLSEIAYHLYVSRKFYDRCLPLTPVKEYVSRRRQSGLLTSKWGNYIGYDVAQVRRKCLGRGDVPVPYLDSLNMNTFSSLRIPQNALGKVYVPRDCANRAGRLLIAGVARLWLPTVGVVASYCDNPAISQVAWTLPLDQDDAKIQVLWLNSTLGLLHFLSLRQDSKGGFVQLKKRSLGELMLVEKSRLDEGTRRGLLQLFEKFADTRLGSIRKQLEDALKQKGPRFEIDSEFLKVLGYTVDEKLINLLTKIYGELLDETLLS